MSQNPKFIVVFKNSASQTVIDKQAAEVDQNGGSVKNKFNSIVMKGFSAEIPETFLMKLQSNLKEPASEIAYIEPDSMVTTQQL